MFHPTSRCIPNGNPLVGDGDLQVKQFEELVHGALIIGCSDERPSSPRFRIESMDLRMAWASGHVIQVQSKCRLIAGCARSCKCMWMGKHVIHTDGYDDLKYAAAVSASNNRNRCCCPAERLSFKHAHPTPHLNTHTHTQLQQECGGPTHLHLSVLAAEMDSEGVKEDVASSRICLASAIRRILGVLEAEEGMQSEHSEPDLSSLELLSRLEEPRLLEDLCVGGLGSGTTPNEGSGRGDVGNTWEGRKKGKPDERPGGRRFTASSSRCIQCFCWNQPGVPTRGPYTRACKCLRWRAWTMNSASASNASSAWREEHAWDVHNACQPQFRTAWLLNRASMMIRGQVSVSTWSLHRMLVLSCSHAFAVEEGASLFTSTATAVATSAAPLLAAGFFCARQCDSVKDAQCDSVDETSKVAAGNKEAHPHIPRQAVLPHTF
eukprot:581252-Pelagomonas_calceolata.AAC.8